MMLDASEGVTDQDATVLGAVLDAGRALVIAVNKWDGLSDYQREQTEALLSRKLAFRANGPRTVRISAKHGSGLRELFRRSTARMPRRRSEFSTAEVTKALEVAYETNPPPVVRGHVAEAALRPSGRRQSADLRRPRHAPEAPVRELSSATSRTSSASASSWSARRCASSSRKARIRTRTRRTC